MQHLLPRHMQILYMLDDLVRGDAIRQAPDDEGFLRSVAIIDKSGDWRVRMGNLAFAGARRVNGVSQLHTDLMKASVFRDMDRLYPGKIVNKTNGVTPRRWLFEINPGLTALVREAAGEGIMTDAGKLVALRKNAEDSAFRARFAAVKRSNKERLAAQIKARQDIAIDPAAMFDVQIKRIHEYKRQLLNLLETVALYQAMRDKPNGDWAPRVKILAGKAAPSYIAAKQIIRLANDVATTINTDPALRGQLKLVFIPNYNVSAAEIIIPAADLSEQISTAGMEASGTGNMKLALNGALTIGTLDGATVEMREHIGAEDVIIFGLTAAQVAARRQSGHDPRANIEMSAALKGALEAIGAGQFSGGDRDRYRSLIDNLYAHDWFMVTADFDAYWHAQRGADALWADDAQWQAKAVRNTAGMGWFSSDRAIRDYARDIWTVPVE
jgi:starch phosphorylase